MASVLQQAGSVLGASGAPAMAVAAGFWYFESRARARRHAGPVSGESDCGHFEGLGALLRREAVVLAIVAVLATYLLARGEGYAPQSAIEAELIERTRKEWPVLTTADSLFALQAMLRVSVLLAALRGLRNLAPGPLSGQPSLLFLAAGVCRACLLYLSPDHHLDGPLSGWTYFGFELAALPLLVKLGAPALRSQQSWVALLTTVAVTAYISSRHAITVSQDLMLDALFTLVQLLELFGSIACLTRTIVTWGGPKCPFTRFAHLLLPLQQGFAFYFFVFAFAAEVEEGATGRPLLILQLAGGLQVVALLIAAVLHFALAA